MSRWGTVYLMKMISVHLKSSVKSIIAWLHTILLLMLVTFLSVYQAYPFSIEQMSSEDPNKSTSLKIVMPHYIFPQSLGIYLQEMLVTRRK